MVKFYIDEVKDWSVIPGSLKTEHTHTKTEYSKLDGRARLSSPSGNKKRNTRITRLKEIIAKRNTFIILIGFLIIMQLLNPLFLQLDNLQNLLRQIAIIGIIGIGTVMVIITGNFDLSVGSMLALGGAVGSQVSITWGTGWGISAALGLGLVLGLVNGLVVAKFHIHSLIATLSTMGLIRGLALLSTSESNISGMPESYLSLGGGTLFGFIPTPFVIFIIIALISSFCLAKTRFGRHLYVVGVNMEAAYLAGIKADALIIATYMYSGMLAVLSGVCLTSYYWSASPLVGKGWELQAIAGVVIGGVSIFGGMGTIAEGLVGIAIVRSILNGLFLSNISVYYEYIVVGILLVVAVLLNILIMRWRIK